MSAKPTPTPAQLVQWVEDSGATVTPWFDDFYRVAGWDCMDREANTGTGKTWTEAVTQCWQEWRLWDSLEQRNKKQKCP
jgi:hypothetical protein